MGKCTLRCHNLGLGLWQALVEFCIPVCERVATIKGVPLYVCIKGILIEVSAEVINFSKWIISIILRIIPSVRDNRKMKTVLTVEVAGTSVIVGL